MPITMQHMKAMKSISPMGMNRKRVEKLAGQTNDAEQGFDGIYEAVNVGGIVGWGAGISNAGLMAVDFGLPVIFGAPSMAMKLTGKSANMLGATAMGGGMVRAGEKVMKPLNYLNDTKLENSKFGAVLSNVAEGISNGAYPLAKRFNDATGYFSWQASRAEASHVKHMQKANSFVAQLHAAPAELHTAVQSYLGAVKQSPEAFAEAGEALNTVAAVHAPEGAFSKLISKITGSADKAHAAHFKFTDATNLAKGEHNTAAFVKNLSVREGLSKTFWGAASVGSLAVSAHETVTDMKALRGMIADLQGKNINEVTSGDALFSDLPHVGNVARQALYSAAAPKAILEAVNAVFNIKMIRGAHVNPLMFMAPMLGSVAVSTFTAGNILDTYKEMKANERAGQENAPEMYAKLIGAAHKELSKRGGGDSGFARELGRIYSDRHASVRDTLQAVNSGQVDKEIAVIREHNSKEAATETPNTQMQSVDSVSSNQLAAQKPELATNFTSSFAERIKASQNGNAEGLAV